MTGPEADGANGRELAQDAPHATELHGAGGAGSGFEPAGGGAAPTKKPGAKWGRRAGWTLAMVSVGIIVGLVIVAAMKFIDGPVTSAGNSVTLAQAVASPSSSPNSGQLSGLYVQLSYPGVFDRVAQLKNDATSLEQFMVSSTSNYTRSIAVDVRPLPSGLLNDDSSYRIRAMDPGTYQGRSDTVAGERVTVFAKTDHTEQTLFWAHKGNIVSVSITSNSIKDHVADFMAVVEPSVRWRQ